MPMTRSPLKRTLLSAAVLSLLLAGCGGGSGGDDPAPAPAPTPTPTPKPTPPAPEPDPLKPFLEQTLSWQACQPASADDQPLFDYLGDRLQCADLRVPRDYRNPDQGESTIELMRASAGDSSRRRGVLLMNPGGPGVDGLTQGAALAVLLSQGNPASTLGGKFKRVSDEYDLIGFSPRGMGKALSFSCESDLTPPAVKPRDFSDENLSNMATAARIQAQACLNHPWAPYIGTEQVAADMDLMRVALGQERISYFGYSYGTWLGAWYASRYPQHIDKIVLDSNLDFTQVLTSNFQYLSDLGFETVLDKVLIPYAARHNAVFGLGQTENAIRQRLLDLRAPLDKALQSGTSDHLYASKQIHNAVAWLVALTGLDTLMAQNPDIDDDSTQALVEQYAFAPDATISDMARKHALGLLDNDEDDDKEGNADKPGVTTAPEDAVMLAVICQDAPPLAFDALVAERRRTLAALPLLSNLSTPAQFCTAWDAPRTQQPSLQHMRDTQVLMVQSEFDGATATVGARASFQALPGARMVFVPKDYQHALAFGNHNACVDEATADYLLGQAPGARETTCAGPTWPLDAQSGATVSTKSAQAPEASTYLDPALAALAAQRIRDAITPKRLK